MGRDNTISCAGTAWTAEPCSTRLLRMCRVKMVPVQIPLLITSLQQPYGEPACHVMPVFTVDFVLHDANW